MPGIEKPSRIIMVPTIFLAILVIFSSASGLVTDDKPSNSSEMDTNSSDSISVEIEDNYVVKLSLNFKNDSIKDFVTDIIFNDVLTYGIETSDILKLFQVDTVTYIELEQILVKFNQTASNIDWLESLLSFTGTSFTVFYEAFTKNLDLKGPNLQRTITALGLNPMEFSTAITFGSSNIFDLLRNGSYAEDNIQNALEITGKNREQVFNAARVLFLTYLERMDPSDFVDQLRQNDLNKDSALELWSALNLTNENVADVEKFNSIITNIYSSFNENPSIGIFTAKDRIVFHHLIYEKFRHIDYSYLQIFAEISTNKSVELDEYNQYVSSEAVEFKLKSQIDNFAEITTNWLEPCSYITIVNNSVIIEEDVDLENSQVSSDTVLIGKNNNTVFNLGSPLICSEKLYALASTDNVSFIQFSKFLGANEDDSLESGTLGIKIIKNTGFWSIFLTIASVSMTMSCMFAHV